MLAATQVALKFVLIGDSGERYSETYAEILRCRPQSVRVIQIRDINPDSMGVEAIDRLTERVSASCARLVLAADSAAAARMAAEGRICIEARAQVRQDKNNESGISDR